MSAELQSRTGSGIGPGGGVQCGTVPSGILLEDGLTQDEAVAIALWNNAAFHEMLSELGVSAAQLYDAGLITDPQFVLFLPLGPKQLELSVFQSVDAIWLRPIRQRAAELDLCQLSRQMIQNGLDLVRDVRAAHADLLLAQERADLSREGHSLRTQIEELAEKRLEAGDISELEATASRIDALQAEATAARALYDLRLAQERLRTLIGLSLPPERIHANVGGENGLPAASAEQLVAAALAMRPDLRAAEIRAAAACKRAELARNQFMNLDVVFDSNSRGFEGYEAGPGLRGTLPIFNGNKGGIAIADAQVQQTNHQVVTLRDRIELEVRTAWTQLQQADEQRRLIDDRILPELATAEELARRNYEDGGVPYFLVLQTTGQFIDAQLRLVQAAADVRRAVAELERSVGGRIARAGLPADVPPAPGDTPSDHDSNLEDAATTVDSAANESGIEAEEFIPDHVRRVSFGSSRSRDVDAKSVRHEPARRDRTF